VRPEPAHSELDRLHELGRKAYVWGYPLVRSAQLRANLTRPRDPGAPAEPAVASGALNAMGHARRLATPATRVGVAPNHDTLYSLAWLDLADGPFVLETPDFGTRYYTFQMGQADSSTDRSLGQRTHGGQLPAVFISGPGYSGDMPADAEQVRSRYRYLLVAGRILVDGPSDLPAVHALQDRIKLMPWGARSTDKQAARTSMAAACNPQPAARSPQPAARSPMSKVIARLSSCSCWHP